MSHVIAEKNALAAELNQQLRLQEEWGCVLKSCKECDELALPWEDYCSDCEADMQQEADAEDWYERRNYIDFADPGGVSSLRAEVGGAGGHCPGCSNHTALSHDFCPKCGYQLNPRNKPCPSCGAKNVLTPQDVAAHYQCNVCASRAEGTYVGADY
jgi:predicted amidophosphoribosyltransferase